MSNFKKGDLVEVVNHPLRPDLVGERFTLSEGGYKYVYESETVPLKYEFVWKTPFKSVRQEFNGENIHLDESKLRKVNPDGDNLSEYTFEELMNNLKLPNKETQNV